MSFSQLERLNWGVPILHSRSAKKRLKCQRWHFREAALSLRGVLIGGTVRLGSRRHIPQLPSRPSRMCGAGQRAISFLAIHGKRQEDSGEKRPARAALTFVLERGIGPWTR